MGVTKTQARASLKAIAHRGPDARGVWRQDGVTLGHVRLSIIDPGSSAADQPMHRGDVVLSFNGEVWNHVALRAELEALGCEFTTRCDTEVVAYALGEWGEAALERFEGMFAMAWWDGRALRLARDRFGEVPMHFARTSAGWAFASERRGLAPYGANARKAHDVEPGEIVQLYPTPARRRYYVPVAKSNGMSLSEGTAALREALEASMAERAMADVPVCCLLSGGIDSGVVAALAKRHLPDLVAYTAVYDERSRDLRCARATTEALEIDLVEVPVPAPTADDLASVVHAIEMPFKAQVEIGWACVHLAQAMHDDGFKVTYSGEGSDELWGSYGFAYHALKTQGWHEYRRDLFGTQARKNFPRCNKVFMARSIECRLPFLNTRLVELALALPRDAVQDGRRRPKAVLQEACGDLLPVEVVCRPKVAFQDGMGLKKACADAVSNPRRFYKAVHDGATC